MRELWQQTGMKTNGRKLLVDSLSEEDENNTESTKNRKYPKRLKRQGQCRVHPKLTSSSSGSSARYGFAPRSVFWPKYQNTRCEQFSPKLRVLLVELKNFKIKSYM